MQTPDGLLAFPDLLAMRLLSRRRRLLLATAILVVAVVVVSLLLEDGKPSLTIREFHFSGCQARVIGEVHSNGRGIEWAVAPKIDGIKPPEKRNPSLWYVPAIQAVHADERQMKVNTHRGLHFFDFNHRSKTVLDVGGTGFTPLARMASGPFEKTIYFPRDWSGGEIVFAARYRKAKGSWTDWLRSNLRRLLPLRRIVKPPSFNMDPGTLIYSEPISVPAADPDAYIDVIDSPDELMRMQGPDGSVSS